MVGARGTQGSVGECKAAGRGWGSRPEVSQGRGGRGAESWVRSGSSDLGSGTPESRRWRRQAPAGPPGPFPILAVTACCFGFDGKECNLRRLGEALGAGKGLEIRAGANAFLPTFLFGLVLAFAVSAVPVVYAWGREDPGVEPEGAILQIQDCGVNLLCFHSPLLKIEKLQLCV